MYVVKQFLGDFSPQPSEPEELQPYASYVQRVNSIYNSSAELFKAWITQVLHECTEMFLIKKKKKISDVPMMRPSCEVCKCRFTDQCTPTLRIKLRTSPNTALNDSWWNPFQKELSPTCRLWWQKHKPEWVRLKEGVEN